MDGNFSAEHYEMTNPEDDVRLADGHGFMTTDQPYKLHLQDAKEVAQVRDSLPHHSASKGTLTACSLQPLICNEHRAVKGASAARKGMESTGIGAVACARHGFFVPHATVDYQLGEG